MEKRTYIGVKLITAIPQDKDGRPGYSVEYTNGYVSWSPKEDFENAYLPLHVSPEGEFPSAITAPDVENLIAEAKSSQITDKSAIVQVTLHTGLELFATSSCVDPVNYSDTQAIPAAMAKITKDIMFGLGFMLQWAKYGLKHTVNQQKGE